MHCLLLRTPLREPARRVCQWLWDTDTGVPWKRRAGRQVGDDGYHPGDLSRTFARKHLALGANNRRRRRHQRGSRGVLYSRVRQVDADGSVTAGRRVADGERGGPPEVELA